ncbi:hypothetical protein C8J56DRAFT_900937 [Mycena floridula]|nr:hypothetical protein C8J56DRAFT_900937 [Mycena floridula]
MEEGSPAVNPAASIVGHINLKNYHAVGSINYGRSQRMNQSLDQTSASVAYLFDISMGVLLLEQQLANHTCLLLSPLNDLGLEQGVNDPPKVLNSEDCQQDQTGYRKTGKRMPRSRRDLRYIPCVDESGAKSVEEAVNDEKNYLTEEASAEVASGHGHLGLVGFGNQVQKARECNIGAFKYRDRNVMKEYLSQQTSVRKQEIPKLGVGDRLISHDKARDLDHYMYIFKDAPFITKEYVSYLLHELAKKMIKHVELIDPDRFVSKAVEAHIQWCLRQLPPPLWLRYVTLARLDVGADGTRREMRA